MSAKILTGLSFEEYSAIEAVNFSTLKLMAVSPLHYRNAVENGFEEKPAFALGSAAHTAVLEPTEWLRRYLIKPEFVERTEKGKTKKVQLKKDDRQAEWVELQARAKAERKTIITEKDNRTAAIVAQRVLLDPAAAKLLRGKTTKEVTVQWTHGPTGLVVRSRLDLVNHSLGAIVDLKTAQNIVPDRWCASAVNYHYLAQFAMYVDAWHAATGEMLPFKALVVEKVEPHDVAVFNISEDDLQFGRDTYEGWLSDLVECRKAGQFLGVARGSEVAFQIPAWAQGREDEVETEGMEWAS